LSRFSTDKTFGQSIAPFGKFDEKYFSYDLTAATDRIPIQVYEKVLRYHFGDKYSQAWVRIKSRLPFSYESGSYKYNTGQPMGLYSSWAMLAYAHHIIVRVASLRCNIKHFKDYRILGDDIVIRNTQVANAYVQIMTDLGVGISKEKSMVSEDTFEFAKRIFTKGREITGFPLAAVVNTLDLSFVEMSTVVLEANKRGYLIRDPEWVESLTLIYKSKFPTGSRAYREARKVYSLFIGKQIKNKEVSPDLVSSLFPNVYLSCVTSLDDLREIIFKEVLAGLSKQKSEAHVRTSTLVMKITGTNIPTPEIQPYSVDGSFRKWMVSDPITSVKKDELRRFHNVVLKYRSKAQTLESEGYYHIVQT
jgi:hypothetical protein